METKPADQVAEARNLVAEITNLLITHNHAQPDGWRGKLPDDLSHLSVDQQRIIINRQLRLVIAQCRENSAAVRFCLIDDGQTKDWLRLFNDTVAPFMVKFNLVY